VSKALLPDRVSDSTTNVKWRRTHGSFPELEYAGAHSISLRGARFAMTADRLYQAGPRAGDLAYENHFASFLSESSDRK
jgi:hypothetical protein